LYIPIVCNGVPIPEISLQKTPVASVKRTWPGTPLDANLSATGPRKYTSTSLLNVEIPLVMRISPLTVRLDVAIVVPIPTLVLTITLSASKFIKSSGIL